MNAIIALCHFCELHGPSVVFCTQAFHDENDPKKVFADLGAENASEKQYYGRPECYQRSNSSGSASSSPEQSTASDTCEACRSIIPGQTGFISNDHEAKVTYMSTQYPFHREVFSLVRQACVRSLSCEVCPGREGPIFFGDEHRGHVLSHTFFLKDSQARGFQRWYSIVVVMMDKIFLLNSWPFLVKHLRTTIDELQEKAEKMHNAEQNECPQRAVRLNSVTGVTPGNFRRQRGATKSTRSLEELVGDKNTFVNLHVWFTWILKAGGNRLSEELLEGPLTEDTVIAIEKQEETEEGFTLITTKKITTEIRLEAGSASGNDLATNCVSGSGTRIRWLYNCLGDDTFNLLAYHTVIGNQIIVRSSDASIVKSVLQALKILLPRGCCNMIAYSTHYVDSWKCNFLGLHPSVAVPPHVEASELHVVVDVVHKRDSAELGSEDFTVKSVLVPPPKNPTQLKKLELAIKNSALSDRVLSFYLVSLKEEWMNKVKVLYKFTRSSHPSTVETQKLLEVLGAHEHDKPVMKFWMTGLSTQFRTHVLSSPDSAGFDA